MGKSELKPKRKFLKVIYAIQEKFGVGFAGVSRTFSFGIKPTREERGRLEEWFRQIGSAKANLYQEVFEHFKKSPSQYLGSKFGYATFFKGSAAFKKARKNYPLFTTQPVGEGLRMEISIPSFITNHKKRFDKAKRSAGDIVKQIEKNAKILVDSNAKIDDDESTQILELASQLEKLDYKDVIVAYQKLQECEELINHINALIGDYNRRLNLVPNVREMEDICLLDKMSRLDVFPGTREKQESDAETALRKLITLSHAVANRSSVLEYITKKANKADRYSRDGNLIRPRLSFESRASFWLTANEPNEQKRVERFVKTIENKITEFKKHISQKPYDTSNKNRYYGFLALRARLAHPDKMAEINTIKSQLSGSFLRIRGEREVVTLPGFSWGAKKPLKNVALAFRKSQLYICVAASAKPFMVGADSKNGENQLRFVKTTGGSRQKAARKPKTIQYVQGSFNVNSEGLPLFLPLHFGKSHARRYLMNKRWGLFSETPKVFLNNARLKRTKKNPGDSWQYFLDVTLSADEKVFGFKEFQKGILSRAKAVIGIDRGEVNPIAYAAVGRSGKILETGSLGREEYIQKLKKYDEKRRTQQARGRLISKALRAKISRLQKTTLETAISEILSLAAKHQAVIAIEDLGRNFRGREPSLIAKKTYKRVEDLLANALHFTGLLRIGAKGPIKYWGGLLSVIAAGTSAACSKCGVQWRRKKPKDSKWPAPKFYALDDILAYSRDRKFQNVNIYRKELTYDKKKLSLNTEWKIYSRWTPQGEIKTIEDLDAAIRHGKTKDIEYFLAGALKHRPDRDTFVCHACGFSGDADENAAVNIARRGIARIDWVLTK